jgi:hypothetical protein
MSLKDHVCLGWGGRTQFDLSSEIMQNYIGPADVEWGIAQRNAHDFMSPMSMKMDESHIYEHLVYSIMRRDI